MLCQLTLDAVDKNITNLQKPSISMGCQNLHHVPETELMPFCPSLLSHSPRRIKKANAEMLFQKGFQHRRKLCNTCRQTVLKEFVKTARLQINSAKDFCLSRIDIILKCRTLLFPPTLNELDIIPLPHLRRPFFPICMLVVVP